MASTETGTARLPLLDGLRGMAALGVMLYHAGLLFQAPGVFARGYLFVDLFFLLSGFVLTLSAEPRMRHRGGGARFLRARFLRLWPVAAAGSALGIAAALIMGSQQNLASHAALGLLLVPAVFGRDRLYPLNGSLWSLFLELVANLAHVLVLRRLGDRWLLVVAAFWGVALIATVRHFGANDVGPYCATWWWALPRLLFSYTLGIWFGRQRLAGAHKPLLTWDGALLLPLTCLITLPYLPMEVAAGDLMVVIVLFPALFWAAAVGKAPRQAEQVLRRLGALSFPLYAVHGPVLEVFAWIGPSTATMALGILATLAAAWAVDAALASARHRKRRLPSPDSSRSAGAALP